MARVAGIELSGTQVAVIGLARSGLAAIELLVRQEARPLAVDEKPLEELPNVAGQLQSYGVPFVRQSPGCWRGSDLVVISPGVAYDAEAVVKAREAGVPVIGELELASYFLRGRTIAISGSNGKTTTTALVHHVLTSCGIDAQAGGNIGTAACSLIPTSTPARWNVLEVSSFQLETVSNFSADIAICLNLTPDHLDRHHTMEAYEAVKARLFRMQQRQDFAILNADDPACVRYASMTRAAPVWFSLTRPVTPGLWLSEGRIVFEDRTVIAADEVTLRGRHNLENVMAATAAAHIAGAALDEIAAAIKSFRGVEHRLERVATIGGVEWFNDSKATNVDATLKAVDAFPGRLWIILGGKDKGGDYRPLGPALSGKTNAALLIGAAAPKIEEHLLAAFQGRIPFPVVACGSLDAAVARAAAGARPGDTVLLAPACASFDQFQDYMHRGRVYKQLVAALVPGQEDHSLATSGG